MAEGTFRSRSHAVRAALDGMLRDLTAEQIDRGFSEGFSRYPETPSELAEAERLAIEAIEEEPWEPWW